MKWKIHIAIGLSAGRADASANAAGVTVLTEKTSGSTFDGSGTIDATSRAASSVATAAAGQRVTAPVLTYRATITATNNTYRNTGRIEATARVMGGVAAAIAGQHVTM